MAARLNPRPPERRPGLKEYTPVFCSFLVFKARPDWHALPPGERATVAETVERVLAASPVRRRGLYSLVGFRQDADLLLWAASEHVSDLQDLAARLALPSAAPSASPSGSQAAFARLFETAAVYLAMAKASPYTGAHVPAFLRGVPPQRFLIMYPFVKTPEWYLLPFEERQRMMGEHGRVGGQWPQVFTNTLYAFGLGDFEFVVAFETAEPGDFLELLERLREVEVRRFTLRDTPIYLATRKPFWDAFGDLGVPVERATLLLEERAETVDALGEGRQVVVLRRGGTKENAFGGVGDTVMVAPPGAETVEVAARVEAVFDVTEPAHLEGLREVHPLRFLWRGPGQPLRAIVLRAQAIPRAPLGAVLERFGEWTELREGVRIAGGRAALSEEEFAAHLARVREALKAEVVEA